MLTTQPQLQLVKSALVENQTLALLSAAYSFPEQILAASASAPSLRASPSISACVFKAYLATVYEEHGAKAFSRFVRRLFGPLLPVAVDALREVYQPSILSVDVDAISSTTHPIGAINEW